MHEGWFKLHRKIVASPIFDNPEALKLWIWMLAKASHKAHGQMVGNQIVAVEAGEFIFGRKAAAAALGMTESKIYRLLKMMEKDGMLEVSSNNKFSIVHIVNWGVYQHGEGENCAAEEQQTDSKRTAEEQQTNTNKNDKKDKNEKEWKEGEAGRAEPPTPKPFVPPALEEIQAYCRERNNQVDAERFLDFYAAKGWMIGKNKMQDWKAALRRWEKQDAKDAERAKGQSGVHCQGASGRKRNGFINYTQSEWDFDELERLERELRMQV